MNVSPSWLSEEGLHTLSSGYLLPGETPRAMFERIAQATAQLNDDPTLFDDVFHCLWNGWVGLASPVAANFGTTRALPISCYSVHLSDSVSSIYSHLKEVAQLSKNGEGLVFIWVMSVPPEPLLVGEVNRPELCLGRSNTTSRPEWYHKVECGGDHLRFIFPYHTPTSRNCYVPKTTPRGTHENSSTATSL